MLHNTQLNCHVRFLSPVERSAEESPEQFSQQVSSILSSQLGLKESKVTKNDIDNWFASLEPPPPPKPVIPSGPIIPPSEFDPTKLGSGKASPEVEAMVQRVTAVLPQVPHTVIRKDLCTYLYSTTHCATVLFRLLVHFLDIEIQDCNGNTYILHHTHDNYEVMSFYMLIGQS